MKRLYGITGWKNSGKTTLVSGLVSEFSRHGLTVSTIKHASDQFDIDKPGTDSHSHRLAGAREVAIASPKRWAIMHELGEDDAQPALEDLVAKLAPCDLVLVEGFKTAPHPKIECIRPDSATENPIWETNDSIKAIATVGDYPQSTLPVLNLNDIPSVAGFIAKEVGLKL